MQDGNVEDNGRPAYLSAPMSSTETEDRLTLNLIIGLVGTPFVSPKIQTRVDNPLKQLV